MKAADLLLSVIALAIGLSALEAVAWLIQPPHRTSFTSSGLMVRDGTLGWRLRNAGVYKDKVISNRKIVYNVKYTIDKDNDRIVSSSNSGIQLSLSETPLLSASASMTLIRCRRPSRI